MMIGDPEVPTQLSVGLDEAYVLPAESEVRGTHEELVLCSITAK